MQFDNFEFAVGSVKEDAREKYKYIHISFDDTINIIKDLQDNKSTYTSAFDNPPLAFLKEMHDKYGAVFSMYCFYDNSSGFDLSQVTSNSYANELLENGDWLKWGFHGRNSTTNYGNGTVTPIDALADYNNVINLLRTFAPAIDPIVRTHNFSGSLEICQAWKTAACKPQGFLTSDDSRNPDMYLNDLQRTAVLKYGDFYDVSEELYFLRTDIRLERYIDPVAELNSRLINKSYAGQMDTLIIFTHEPWLINGSQKTNIENVIKWGIDNGYAFDYPMYNIIK